MGQLDVHLRLQQRERRDGGGALGTCEVRCLRHDKSEWTRGPFVVDRLTSLEFAASRSAVKVAFCAVNAEARSLAYARRS